MEDDKTRVNFYGKVPEKLTDNVYGVLRKAGIPFEVILDADGNPSYLVVEQGENISKENKTKNIIKTLREDAHMTQEELANRLGLKKGRINKYETGLVKNIKKDVVEEMASIFNVSPAYIMGWDTKEYKETEKLPVIGVVRAGVGGIAFEEPLGYEEAYEENCSPDTHFYLKVKGDSMEPKISEGDLALIKKQSDLESGELGIVLINGNEGVIKKVIKGDNYIELRSFNGYYPPRIFKDEEMNEIKIVGKVIKTISNW